jgi:CheY-like chemotaxis protein
VECKFAIDRVSTFTGPIDVALLDVHMPDMDGVLTPAQVADAVTKGDRDALSALLADANKRIEELYQKLYNKRPGSSSKTGARRR